MEGHMIVIYVYHSRGAVVNLWQAIFLYHSFHIDVVLTRSIHIRYISVSCRKVTWHLGSRQSNGIFSSDQRKITDKKTLRNDVLTQRRYVRWQRFICRHSKHKSDLSSNPMVECFIKIYNPSKGENHLVTTLTGTRSMYVINLPLQWRHNGWDSFPNHQPHDCLLNGLFRRRSKETSASLAFVRGIHRDRWIPRTNGQ